MHNNILLKPESESALERRITARLVAYWERIRRNRPMPLQNDIDPTDLADLWDCCFLVQVRGEAMQDYRYYHIGAGLAEAYATGIAKDAPGGQAALIAFTTSKLAGSYARVIASRKPVIEEGEFINGKGELVKYRQCMLPLGQGEIVQAIFGGVRFKLFLNQK